MTDFTNLSPEAQALLDEMGSGWVTLSTSQIVPAAGKPGRG